MEGNTVLYALIIIVGMIAAVTSVLLFAWLLVGRRQRNPNSWRSVRMR